MNPELIAYLPSLVRILTHPAHLHLQQVFCHRFFCTPIDYLRELNIIS